MKKYCLFFWSVVVVLLVAGCKNEDKESFAKESSGEDELSQKNLQGIWIDEETENALFMVKGDTFYYPDTVNLPMPFYVKGDTLVLGKQQEMRYPIKKITQHIFRFLSATGEVVKLVKSEETTDSLLFMRKQIVPLTYNQVVKKDTVVFCQGERYHCYIYVNPSRMKVYKTSYTDEGLAVNNVYYDNVIHISVYQGKKSIYSRDYSKKQFKNMIPDRFLNQAILSNMEFDRASSDGFHFNATVCIPDGASCYMLEVSISPIGEDKIMLIDN